MFYNCSCPTNSDTLLAHSFRRMKRSFTPRGFQLFRKAVSESHGGPSLHCSSMCDPTFSSGCSHERKAGTLIFVLQICLVSLVSQHPLLHLHLVSEEAVFGFWNKKPLGILTKQVKTNVIEFDPIFGYQTTDFFF